jgi:predicted nuclease of predicted toxin-antitoxin system
MRICSTAKVLKNLGYEALNARDCGLRGKSDNEVFKFAQKEGAIVLTADLGFGNILHFPLGSHSVILIVRFPNEVSTAELNRQIELLFGNLSEDFRGNLVVLEPGRITVKRR